jgi:hypothetical protein
MRKIPKPMGALSDSDSRPGDFPLGSVESRAAARAAIVPEPCINIVFGRDCEEKMRFAQIPDLDGAIFERLPGETFAKFTRRMVNLPGRKQGGLITSYTVDRPSRPSIPKA